MRPAVVKPIDHRANRLRRRMWEVARKLQIPCSPHTRSKTGCPWDGSVLHGKVLSSFEESDWWHEIGHFLVAPEEGQKLPGWGQGMVYDGSDGGPVISEDLAEEQHASAVGIWCQIHLGKDPEGGAVHSEYHSWHPSPENTESHPWFLAHRFPDVVKNRVSLRLEAAGFLHPWAKIP